MSIAQNKVISGLYANNKIKISKFVKNKEKHIETINYLQIVKDFSDPNISTENLKEQDIVIINETTVKSIEVVNIGGIQNDNGSGLARGIVGGLLLGGAGLVAGANLGKQDSANLLQITWLDDQKSLIEVDGNIFNMLNTICWNIQNNIENNYLTKEEILAHIEENKKKSEIETENDRNIYLKFLYCISILIFLSGIMGLFGSVEERFYALGSLFIGFIMFPPVRAKINAYFLPKFKNHNTIYGIVKFFVVMCIAETLMLFPLINTTDNNTSTTQQVKPEIPAQKLKTSNKPVKTENNYYSVANTLKNYYKNYFNNDNWYINSVIPIDKTINVSMIVVDPTWQENIKKYPSSRQYMVNCACPNSYKNIWTQISKSDVSVTIFDTNSKRIGGGVCTN